jgi:radical SAM superfamily enzyme YgiQ (UPF0313 family)
MQDNHPRHPLKTRAKVLLSSVFGPYARDDAFGSRQVNPMELYHNQVTRAQGVFSLRMFHRSFGLLMIQANIDTPSTLLDFPDLERFEAEIRDNHYDIVGISSIIPNVGKVKKMCELVRSHLPRATIVIGGHVANLPDLAERISADHIVKGDGIGWFRRYLGQDDTRPIRHPQVLSAHGTRILGHSLTQKTGDTAAIVVPSVGCPMGCNFCSTSNLFGGKGHFVNFYETGDELFAIMCELEEKLQVASFFMMDENFLLHRKRALRLLELVQQHNKSWSLYIFSSARVLQSYTTEQLVSLGVSWVWMGLEGRKSRYRKLNGIDTLALVKGLQAHGIRVLGSSIIGLENHTMENIDQVIDYAVSHDTDFHQFMLYTALPGTPLHRELQEKELLLPEAEMTHADSHGQYRFNHRHPHIHDHQEEGLIQEAFRRDFEKNGPSLYRLIRTMLQGWLRYRDHRDERILKRYAEEMRPLRTTYAAAVWAMGKWYRNSNPALAAKLRLLLQQLYQTFGWQTRLYAPTVGRYIHFAMHREEKRLALGWSPEPATFCEKKPAREIEVTAQTARAREQGLPQMVEPPLFFSKAN